MASVEDLQPVEDVLEALEALGADWSDQLLARALQRLGELHDQSREIEREAQIWRRRVYALHSARSDAEMTSTMRNMQEAQRMVPRGNNQRAVLEILRDAGRPLRITEIHHYLRNQDVKLTRQALHNLLSRMARRDPPLLVRPKHGLYEPARYGSHRPNAPSANNQEAMDAK